MSYKNKFLALPAFTCLYLLRLRLSFGQRNGASLVAASLCAPPSRSSGSSPRSVALFGFVWVRFPLFKNRKLLINILYLVTYTIFSFGFVWQKCLSLPAPHRRLGRRPPTRAVPVKPSPRYRLAVTTTRRLRVKAAVNRRFPNTSRRCGCFAFAERLDCGDFSAAFRHHHGSKVRPQNFLNRYNSRFRVPPSSFNVRLPPNR